MKPSHSFAHTCAALATITGVATVAHSVRAQTATNTGSDASSAAAASIEATRPQALPTDPAEAFNSVIDPLLRQSPGDTGTPTPTNSDGGITPLWPHTTQADSGFPLPAPPGPDGDRLERPSTDQDSESPQCRAYYGDRRYFVIRHNATSGRWFHGDQGSYGVVTETHPVPGQHVVICIDDDDLRTNYSVAIASTSVDTTPSGPSNPISQPGTTNQPIAAPTRATAQRLLPAHTFSLWQKLNDHLQSTPALLSDYRRLAAQLTRNSNWIASALTEITHLQSTEVPSEGSTAAHRYPGVAIAQRPAQRGVERDDFMQFNPDQLHSMASALHRAQAHVTAALQSIGNRTGALPAYEAALQQYRTAYDAWARAPTQATQRRALAEYERLQTAATLRYTMEQARFIEMGLARITHLVIVRSILDSTGRVLWAATYLTDRRQLAVYEALDRLSRTVTDETLSQLERTLRVFVMPRSTSNDCLDSACSMEADLASILPSDIRVAGGNVYYLPAPRGGGADAGADARSTLDTSGSVDPSVLQNLQVELAISTRTAEYISQFARSLRRTQRVFDLGVFGENRLLTISVKKTRRTLELENGAIRVVPHEQVLTRTETVESVEHFAVRAGFAITTAPAQTFTASRNNIGDVVIGATTDYTSIVQPVIMAAVHLCGVNPRIAPVFRACGSGDRYRRARWWWLIPAPTVGLSTTSRIFENLFLGATWSPTNFLSVGAGLHIGQQQMLRPGFQLGDPLNGIELSSTYQGSLLLDGFVSVTLSSEVFSGLRGFQQ